MNNSIPSSMAGDQFQHAEMSMNNQHDGLTYPPARSDRLSTALPKPVLSLLHKMKKSLQE